MAGKNNTPPSQEALVNANLRRLRQLAAEHGIRTPPPGPQLTSLPRPPLAPSSNDTAKADELIAEHRRAAAANPSAQSGLMRALSSNRRKGADPKDLFDVLSAQVHAAGSPGVAEALIAKLFRSGADINGTQAKSSKPNFLQRRKSSGLLPRGRLLIKAIENEQPDMVAVLAPHADPVTMETALPMAIRQGNPKINELLLRHGASVADSEDSEEAFRHLCRVGRQPDLVSLLLRSEHGPSASTISGAMVDASLNGCLETVLRLSYSTADGSYQNAAALQEAIKNNRPDIALAILTGAHPPTVECLNNAFALVPAVANIKPEDELLFTEMLLCAGAGGDATAHALVQACASDESAMVDLLTRYAVSVEHADAKAVREAIDHRKVNLLQMLLGRESALSASLASECLKGLPKDLESRQRNAMLELLLTHGAGGEPLNDALIVAVEAGDIESARLLVTPVFTTRRMSGPPGLDRPINGRGTDRHEVASVNYRGGHALKVAVSFGFLEIAKVLLSRQPEGEILTDLFPQVQRLTSRERYAMTESFLQAGLPGPTVSDALQHAINEEGPSRDEPLIALLLKYDADVNFKDGAGLLAAVAQQDVPLLDTLLKGNVNPLIVAAAVPQAMLVVDRELRLQIIQLLLQASPSGNQLSEALTLAVKEDPADLTLVMTLLQKGGADVNYNSGEPFLSATSAPTALQLQALLQHGRPLSATLEVALLLVPSLPPSEMKTKKMSMLLERSHRQQALDKVLWEETSAVAKLSSANSEKADLSTLRLLLQSGANVNSEHAWAICHAVAKSNMPILELLLSKQPTAESLGCGLHQALYVDNPTERLGFVQIFLDAGAPEADTNLALKYAVSKYPSDIPLIRALAVRADLSDGELLWTAVQNGSSGPVGALLEAIGGNYPVDTLNKALAMAVRTADPQDRIVICELLLGAGANVHGVSDALLIAASEGDDEFAELLLSNGAVPDYRNGVAILQACRSGHANVLRRLLATCQNLQQTTLLDGFQASSKVDDVDKRTECFRLLLENGVRGEVVNAQLVSAAQAGESATELLKILVQHGADPDHGNGQAVQEAIVSGFLDGVEILLGLVDLGGKQKIPSQPTLRRALRSSSSLGGEQRLQVVDWLFAAGLSASSEVMQALDEAVKEDPANIELARLLLDNAGSPVVDGNHTLMFATRDLIVPVVDLFLQYPIPEHDLSVAFRQTFTPDNSANWLSEDGLSIARGLLERGASGDGVSAALATAIGAFGTEEDDIATQFFDMLIQYDVDIDYQRGLALQNAVKKGRFDIVGQMLERKPGSDSVTRAFSHVLDLDVSEEVALQLLTQFIDYDVDGERLDVMFKDAERPPVLQRALDKYPRSEPILQVLLDAGYYHNQPVSVPSETASSGHEPVSLLYWTLVQPQKRISSNVIKRLIARGANVNFASRQSKLTPLMLAVNERRLDIVHELLIAGAQGDATDMEGNTPLTLASHIGGDIGSQMMGDILKFESSQNDGSLHNAARELNLNAVQVLVEHGHDVDFPSTLHEGRSALGEVCLRAGDEGPINATQEKCMERVMRYLVQQGANLRLQVHDKSVLHLALESQDPVPTVRVLLKVGMWKHVNDRFNEYNDGTHTYSPTMYVQRKLARPEEARQELLALLRAGRARDVYYANEGAQPADAVGLPEELLAAERHRRARAERVQTEAEDHARQLAQAREVAQAQEDIVREQAREEDERQRVRHEERLAQLEAENQASLQLEGQRQTKMLEWEDKANAQKLAHEAEMAAARAEERRERERVEKESHDRQMKRLSEQNRLADKHSTIAGNFNGTNGTTNGVQTKQQRRLVGYVTGEVD